jgi:hypothetical protein
MDRRVDAARRKLDPAFALDGAADSSKTNMSLARASDQWMPKGRIMYWPWRPGTVTVK